jgi:hypothetical protein
MAQLKTLVVTGATRTIGPLYGGSMTLTGTLVLNKTTDLSGTANNGPALIIGGAQTGVHMEIDANEIHAKSTGTAVADLYLNSEGGTVYQNGKPIPVVYTGTAAPAASTGKNGDIYIVTG